MFGCFISREQQQLTMHLKDAKMLAVVVHENMKLGDNTPNNERLSLNISEL